MKTILTVLLLSFVAGSIVYLVVNEARQKSEASTDVKKDEKRDLLTGGKGQGQLDADGTARHKVIAYYFHGTKRCRTCKAIESLIDESLKWNFAKELESGKLEWHSVNFDEPQNEHFAGDFQLSMSTLVLVDVWDGKRENWKKLDSTWELYDDKQAFDAYVQVEVRNFLGE